MNVINRAFLKLALFPSALYTRMGVDALHLRAILTTKLTLDDRRPHPIAQARNRGKQKPVSMATLSTMFMSAVMGFLFLFCFFIGQDTATQLTFYFTFFFVLLSLTLITDFTSVLIDIRDNFILLPKPVSDKTIVVARLLHIFIHLCKIVVPMSLPGAIYLGYNTGIYAALVLLFLIFLLAGFSIFFINAVYILILRFTTPQRFQAIITWVQIIFAILMYGSYQLFPRLLSRYTGEGFAITDFGGIVLYPLYWLANSWNLLYSLSGNFTEVATGILGLVFPLLCMVAVVKYLAPSFNRKLSLLSAGEGSAKKTPAVAKTVKGTGAGIFSRLLTFSAVEKASFVFTLKMMGRSRDFKMRVYPSIGYLVVFGAYILFTSKNLSLDQLSDNNPEGKWILLSALYISVFLLNMAISQVVYSEKYKASWIFYTSPVERPGHIVSGAIKAVLLTFYVPLAVGVSLIAIPFGGAKILPNLLLALSNVVLIITLMTYSGNHYFPFSSSQSTNAKTGSFLSSLFVFFLAGLVAFGHFLIYTNLPVVIICTVLSLVAVWYLFDTLRQMSWKKVLSGYTEE